MPLSVLTFPTDLGYENVDGEWGETVEVASFERFTRDEVQVYIFYKCFVRNIFCMCVNTCSYNTMYLI